MKKLFFLVAFVSMAGFTLGQTLEKGNLIGAHVLEINLDPDVTYNQYKDHMINKLIPAWDNVFEGEIKMYVAEADRGDDENYVNVIYVFKSVEIRDKYFSQDGSQTELLQTKLGKIQAIREKQNKLGTFTKINYTDWVIQ